MKSKIFSLVLLLAVAFIALPCVAGTNGNTVAMTATLTIPETLSVTPSGSFTATSAQVNAGVLGNASVSVTGALIPANHTLGILLETYFSSTTAYTASGNASVASVPSSAVQIKVGAGTAQTCNQTDSTYSLAPAGAGCGVVTLVPQSAVTAGGWAPATATLTANPVSANFGSTYIGSYTGTLNVVAFAP